jgi:hypothetical protein
MMKDTALVSVLGVPLATADIFRRADLVGKASFKNLEALLLAAAMYWILTVIFSYFQGRLERRVSRGYVRGAPGGAPDKAGVPSSSSAEPATGGADGVAPEAVG